MSDGEEGRPAAAGAQFDAALGAVDALLSRVVEAEGGAGLRALNLLLQPLERAKLSITLSYAMATLYFCLKRCTALDDELAEEDLRDHPIRAELSRIRGYFAKLKKAKEALSRDKPPPPP